MKLTTESYILRDKSLPHPDVVLLCIYVYDEDSLPYCAVVFCPHQYTCEESSRCQEISGYNKRDCQSHLQVASRNAFLQGNVVVRLQNGSLNVNRKMAVVQHSSHGRDL